MIGLTAGLKSRPFKTDPCADISQGNFLVMELILANPVALAIHPAVERPTIHLFRKIRIGPSRASATSVSGGR